MKKTAYDYHCEPRRDILCIDVKSFFASVECVTRGYDPLKKMLVVMSNADNAGGLILAASPEAKRKLGISNVSRKYNLPVHPDLEIVPPRMALYVEYNNKINNLYRQYVSDEDLLPYSIDESFLDVTGSHLLFGQSTYHLALKIQKLIRQNTGLYVTVGIGDNPLLAKLALDNEAKKNADFIAYWRYETVADTIWKINPITDMWGIGHRTARNLRRLGIESTYSLAHYDPYTLRKNFGVMGEQLYSSAWGIDRSRLSQRHTVSEKSYGNSQVLPRDYTQQAEIEIVIRETAEHVAARIRKHHCATQCVHLYIRYSHFEKTDGFSHQMHIPPTSSTRELSEYCLLLFKKYHHGEAVRQIAISYSQLVPDTITQFHFFSSPDRQIAEKKLDTAIDRIREHYGFSAVVRGSSLNNAGTAIRRATLLGGHASGLSAEQIKHPSSDQNFTIQ